MCLTIVLQHPHPITSLLYLQHPLLAIPFHHPLVVISIPFQYPPVMIPFQYPPVVIPFQYPHVVIPFQHPLVAIPFQYPHVVIPFQYPPVMFSYRVIRLTSPNLNYLIGFGVILVYISTAVFFVQPTTNSSVAGRLCIVSIKYCSVHAHKYGVEASMGMDEPYIALPL